MFSCIRRIQHASLGHCNGHGKRSFLAFLQQEEVKTFLHLLLAFNFDKLTFLTGKVTYFGDCLSVLRVEFTFCNFETLAAIGNTYLYRAAGRNNLLVHVPQCRILLGRTTRYPFAVHQQFIVFLYHSHQTHIGKSQVRNQCILVGALRNKLLHKADQTQLVLYQYALLIEFVVAFQVNFGIRADIRHLIHLLVVFYFPFHIAQFTRNQAQAVVDKVGSIHGRTVDLLNGIPVVNGRKGIQNVLSLLFVANIDPYIDNIHLFAYFGSQ